ncbi:YppE family protein [Lysinibacillus capsici]|uniref:YppE family protein n=1 Tax=Lysinibacillus capsici TaxID=2115968 RepID=UPI002A826540|nr:YppE family protein [Lysinibacillus capsici]
MLVIQQTSKLIDECDQCVSRFWQMREEDRTPDFFQEVKPHADEIHQFLKEWQQEANKWIQKNRPKYMHTQQIASVVESMEQFVVQSFYKETSKKRFLDAIHSTSYTLKIFERLVKEGETDAIEETND